MPPSAAAAPQVPAPVIASAAEAAAVLIEIGGLMTELCQVVEAETDMVRTGRLTAATRVAERKSELARAFISNASRMQTSMGYLAHTAPPLLDTLRRQNEQLRARLQVNLTVLATARAVSEGILRGVSDELARRSTVQTYEASGRHRTQARRPATPIAVSRSL